jgi:DMSO/TMAO reductase YedYZ molybdopterin-dependent catalytic subunit
LTIADLQLMPQDELRDDFKCREGWMVPDLSWRGVLPQTVFALARPHHEARHVQASAGDFSISLPLGRADGALLAISLNTVAPCVWLYLEASALPSVKWLDHLELRSEPGLNTAERITLARLSSSCDSSRSGS